MTKAELKAELARIVTAHVPVASSKRQHALIEALADLWNPRPSPIESGDVAGAVRAANMYRLRSGFLRGDDGFNYLASSDAKGISEAILAALSPSPEGGEIAGFRRITSEDQETLGLLYAPPERLSDKPDTVGEYRVAKPRHYTWATHIVPLSDLLAALMAPPSANEGYVDPREESLRWFMRMVDKAAGYIDTTEHRNSPLNVFCDDFEPLDTFNLAIERGLITTSHNSDWDTGSARITDAGREYVAAMLSASPSTPRGSGEAKALDLARALRHIAEGNLGDGPGQATYETIRQVARNAIADFPFPAPTLGSGEAEAVRADLRASVERAGSYAAWAKPHGLSDEYTRLVANGHREPAGRLLKALGWKRVTTYQRITGV